MGRQKKTGKNRLEQYYWSAKTQGYRARSAFKLVQIGTKFNIFNGVINVLDLCAAPGGWMQVCREQLPLTATIVGVDLVPIQPIKGCVGITADITTARCRTLVKQHLQAGQVDLVLCDGAGNTGTAANFDFFSQNELVLHALKLACEFMKPNGTFITKVFRSADYNSLLWVFNQMFRRVQATKPKSSREVSAEIFVVCQDYLAPSSIDPKYFSPKWVFKTDAEGNPELEAAMEKSQDILQLAKKRGTLKDFKDTLNKRHRGGYEEGDDFRTANVQDFFESMAPEKILLLHNQLVFRPDSEFDQEVLKQTPQTILEDIVDLKVSSKSDLAKLLRWRHKILAARAAVVIAENRERKAAREAELQILKQDPEFQDKAAEEELERLISVAAVDLRRERKKARELKKKHDLRVKRSLAGAIGVEDFIDDDLWRGGIEIMNDLEQNEPQYTDIAKEMEESSDDEYRPYSISEHESMLQRIEQSRQQALDYDPDHHLEQLEEELEERYENELQGEDKSGLKKKKSEKKESRRKKKLSEWNEEFRLFAAGVEKTGLEKQTKNLLSEIQNQEDDDSDPDDEFIISKDETLDDIDQNKNEELKIINNNKSNNEINYENNISDDEKSHVSSDHEIQNNENENDGIIEMDENEIPKMPLTDKERRKLKRKKETDRQNLKIAKKQKQDQELWEGLGSFNDSSALDEAVSKNKNKNKNNNKNNIEIVPPCVVITPPKTHQEIAEVQSLGSLLVDPRERLDLIDGMFNRNSFNDDPGLPKWFIDDEKVHRIQQVQMSKEQSKQLKQKLKEIAERPIRKVLEARGRKKKQAAERLDRIRKKALDIADSPDLNEAGKTKQIRALVSKSKRGEKKRDPVYMVTKKAGGAQPAKRGLRGKGKGVRVVDKRLKKDKRAARAQRKRQK